MKEDELTEGAEEAEEQDQEGKIEDGGAQRKESVKRMNRQQERK